MQEDPQEKNSLPQEKPAESKEPLKEDIQPPKQQDKGNESDSSDECWQASDNEDQQQKQEKEDKKLPEEQSFFDYNSKDEVWESKETKQLNRAFLENKEYVHVDHEVDHKHLVVLATVARKETHETIKNVDGTIDLHARNQGRIRIIAQTQQIADATVDKLQDLIDETNIVFLNMPERNIWRLKESQQIRNYLQQRKMIIFRSSAKDNNYYLGGLHPPKILNQVSQELKNKKFNQVRLYRYKNTRTFRLLLTHLFNFKTFKTYLSQTFRVDNIDVLQTATHNNEQQKYIHVSFTTTQRLDCSIKELEIKWTNFIKQNFYVIIFVTEKMQYMPKMNTERVKWGFIREKESLDFSYVYFITQKIAYQGNVKEIIEEIEAMKKRIIGFRFLQNFSPIMSDMSKNEKSNLKIVKFPTIQPYSWVHKARKDEEFLWKRYLNGLLQ